jgi:hypothetical protein
LSSPHSGGAWQKSPDDLIERFGRVLDRFPEAERRKMFGYPAAFIGGNMVTGLHGRNWVVRLPEAELMPAMHDGATAFEPMPGRPMKSFVALPADILEDEDRVAAWVDRAIAHGRTMPAKK